MNRKVYVGLSGGVDSSVTALMLLNQGYEVTGVFMKNWSQDLPGFDCPWKEDYQDAKRVAVHLGIPFKMYDFETEYRDKVVQYMLDEYMAGRTPNPDIMCNQEIKFKLFLETALNDGADMIATGHYSRIKDGKLLTAKNIAKDQSYFLYRITEQSIRRSIMPIGEFNTKDEVREIAREYNLPTANKKDSQGICFVGKVGIKEFLHQFVETSPGKVVDENSREIGVHDGAIFYTIGQRHGLNIGGGLPYYVVGKDMAKNEVYVTTKLDDSRLWLNDITVTDVHWINGQPDISREYQIRTRYRAPLVTCTISPHERGLNIKLSEEVRAITPGQSAVIYDGEHVLGGGIVV